MQTKLLLGAPRPDVPRIAEGVLARLNVACGPGQGRAGQRGLPRLLGSAHLRISSRCLATLQFLARSTVWV
jgi:hypothetical protein